MEYAKTDDNLISDRGVLQIVKLTRLEQLKLCKKSE